MINLYKVGNSNYTWNGDATLTPMSCLLDLTINGSWVLKVECPYDDEKKYEMIEVGDVLGVEVDCVDEQTNARQLFRIYDYTKGTKAISIVAYPIAMESTYDTPIANLNITDKTAQQAMTALQAYTNKYTLWTNVSSGTHSAQYENTSINSAIANGKDNSFIEVWGGEIVYDNYNYKVYSRIGDNETEQTVAYGRNITDINYKTDESGLITRIFPVSKDGIRLNGNGYVDSSHINDYPYVHARFLQTSNTLVDAKETSNSRTAQLTRSISSQIQALASTLSHTAYNNAIANRAWEREYIKAVRNDIITAVQDYCTQNIYQADMVSVIDKAISNGMAWMKDIQSVEYNWHGDYTNGWWYGVDNNEYCKNEYAFIDRKWCWFNSEGYWVEKWDDSSDNWDWVQPKGATGKKYGNNKKYYAHDDWVYQTVDGVLKCYWMNEEGWYEDAYTGESSWVWQPWGSGWWFGEEGASSEDLKKFAHDQWLFIDGTYYFFDHEGWYDGNNKIENYAWDWIESNQRYWFGNEDKEYQATYLVNQWAKIDNAWHKFDANGFDINADTLSSQISNVFKTAMAELKTLCESLNTQAYNLLYTLLREFCANKYANHVDLPEVQINLNLVDLSKTKEYADFESFEKIRLGDAVRCVDYEHNITTTQRVVSLTYDCIRGYNTKVTVGVADSSVADKIGANAGGQPVAGGFDTSAMEQRISANTTEVGRLQQTKQDKLTAGENITIVNDVISATGGGQGLEYWEETSQRFYRDYKVEGISADEGFKKTEWIQEHYSSYTTSEGLLYRKKGSAPVIAGEVGDGTLRDDCRRIVMASRNQDDLDWQWATCSPAVEHLVPTSEWHSKESYPLIPAQTPLYEFGWQTATITYNNETWYIMAIQPMYGSGYSHLTNGTLEVKHAGTGAMQMTCAELGQFLLEQVHASSKVDAQVSIGVNGNVFQWIVDGEEVAWINEDGTSSFDREDDELKAIEISKAQYDELTPEQKQDENKIYFVYDD